MSDVSDDLKKAAADAKAHIEGALAGEIARLRRWIDPLLLAFGAAISAGVCHVMHL